MAVQVPTRTRTCTSTQMVHIAHVDTPILMVKLRGQINNMVKFNKVKLSADSQGNCLHVRIGNWTKLASTTLQLKCIFQCARAF